MQTCKHNSNLGTHIISCYRKGVAIQGGGAECEGTEVTATPPQTTATLQSVLSCLPTGIPHPQQEVHQGKSHVVRKRCVYPEWQADVSNNAALLGCGSLQQGKRSLTVNNNAACSRGNFSRSFNANKQNPTAKLKAAHSLATAMRAVGLGTGLLPEILKVWRN